jgi:hypothetical protein
MQWNAASGGGNREGWSEPFAVSWLQNNTGDSNLCGIHFVYTIDKETRIIPLRSIFQNAGSSDVDSQKNERMN